jgi:transposase
MRLFVGEDWAEDHHDVELMDERGRVLARGRLPEGVAGMARLHELIGEQPGEGADDAEVVIGTGTDRGPWVAALVAAGYTVYGVNPLQASRYRARHGVSGAKSDRGDAHMLADMVRTDSRQLRAVAGDSPGAEAVKVVARTHKTLIQERAGRRLRHKLREYFPAALEAFDDLDAPDALELLGKAPDRRRPRSRPGRRYPPLSSAPAAGSSPARPPSSWRRCAAPSWASRRPSPPPTRSPSAP